MTARKWAEIAMGVVALVHPGLGPMKPDEIYSRQEEVRIAESTRGLENETQSRVSGRYQTVEARPFEPSAGSSGSGPDPEREPAKLVRTSPTRARKR